MNVGDRVRIERDETLYPSKGTWPQFRGKTGTIVEINEDRKRPHLTEYGIVFDNSRGNSYSVTWFKAHEITVRLASQRPVDGGLSLTPMADTRRQLAHAGTAR